MGISAVALSDIGRVRGRNEDSFLLDTDASLYAVADGMGGHAAGDVASQTAIAAFHGSFLETHSTLIAMKSANRAVLERSAAEPNLLGMGTTLTGVHFFGTTVFVAHVGDSRLYLLRAEHLRQLTRDHTVAQERIEQGALTKVGAMGHPMSSMLTRALGLRPELDIDVFQHDVLAGDRFLICSDGLTGMITDNDLCAMLLQDKNMDAIAAELVEAANLRGGTDNITVVLMEVS
jgi:serine/threonine protein phosphatase PrpC